MHRIILCAMAMFLAASCVSAQAAPQTCQVSGLPEDVRNVLESEYGGWRIQSAGDLQAGFQKAWEAKRPGQCPGIVSGHFEGKADLSYALLLIPRSKAEQAYRLIVFSKKSGKDSYFSIVLDQSDTESASGAAIYRAEPGLQFNEEKFSAFKLRLDGIYFESFEKGGYIYYWKRGRYQRVIESD
jgi:hypothetical protein